MNDRHLVFVYGSLLSGFHNHRLILGNGDGIKIGDAHTIAGGWRMLDLGAFPGLVRDGAGPAVVGEVYDVDDAVLARLDRLEGYPHFYDRSQVGVSCGGAYFTAWVYHLAGPGRADGAATVPGNDWRAHRPDMIRGVV